MKKGKQTGRKRKDDLIIFLLEKLDSIQNKKWSRTVTYINKGGLGKDGNRNFVVDKNIEKTCICRCLLYRV